MYWGSPSLLCAMNKMIKNFQTFQINYAFSLFSLLNLAIICTIYVEVSLSDSLERTRTVDLCDWPDKYRRPEQLHLAVFTVPIKGNRYKSYAFWFLLILNWDAIFQPFFVINLRLISSDFHWDSTSSGTKTKNPKIIWLISFLYAARMRSS